MKYALKDVDTEEFYVSRNKWTKDFFKSTKFSKYNPVFYLILLYLRSFGKRIVIKKVILMSANIKVFENLNPFGKK